ncbi:TetR-like C-terminal domain-containing protein [Gallaecimonas kandeliae]|uniref:TetR/AcrR family transcriptional regulator n=1 Tax=Gallaecimonas kandeliae TaxID=3029055 RepID=UPI002647D69E|nr:TetR-like C-terminal domain-containing protein [Gallaecimonas kandeliae]WKE64558.1 TetR-like C-terminal domain-containing protein [Gallaecimonas kandeliae]
MGRRKDHDPAQLDQRVLETVQAELQGQGIEGLSLRRLAGLIGYAPSTLVSHYGSYALLLLRVNRQTLDDLASALAQQDDTNPSTKDPRQQLLATALGYLDFARERPHAFRLLFEHKLPPGEPMPADYQQRLDGLFHAVEAPLARLNPALPANALRLEARTLWASVHGICLLDIDDKLFLAGADGQAMIATLLGHFLDKEQP